MSLRFRCHKLTGIRTRFAPVRDRRTHTLTAAGELSYVVDGSRLRPQPEQPRGEIEIFCHGADSSHRPPRSRRPPRQLLDGSITYQDIRNTSDTREYAGTQGKRLPARPWLFGSFGVRGRAPGLLHQQAALEPFYNSRTCMGSSAAGR